MARHYGSSSPAFQLFNYFHRSNEAHSKQIDLQLELPDLHLAVNATERGLEKIIGNLIGNAIKYTRERGKVSVTAADCGKEVQLIVSDDGIGISEEDIPKIGEEFFRARNALEEGIKGTGLGMSIVKQLLDHYGGRMAVSSRIGQGTTFTLWLPKNPPG